MLKTYQRETKLFEFSRDANREGLKIRKKRHSICTVFVAIALLQWLHCNGFVAAVFISPVCLCLKTKFSVFLKAGYTGKYRLVVKDF